MSDDPRESSEEDVTPAGGDSATVPPQSGPRQQTQAGPREPRGAPRDQYVLGVDVGTSTLRCHVYDKLANVKGSSSKKVHLLHPQPGWVEMDPEVLWTDFVDVVNEAIRAAGVTAGQVAGLGISTQRCTFTMWDRETGELYHNFLTWQDLRGSELVESWNNSLTMKAVHGGGSLLYLMSRSKRFLAANVLKFLPQQLRRRAFNGLVSFGTIDTWLLWKLTGETMEQILYEFVEHPHFYLSSSGGYKVADQQAAMFGECCFEPGDVKCTMGTGSFMDINVGSSPHTSMAGLYPLIGWKIGDEIVFLAEGNASDTGTAIDWARSIEALKIALFDYVDGVQHQGQVRLRVWMVFSTKDRCVCLCVDGVQHQGQVCLPVCGWCSAPRTGVFACVWMVFSTKDRCVCLCVDGVQHQGQVCLPVCGWCSAPRTGVFACVWMVFSTKDRCVCLCVDGVQHQGQVCLPVCGWCSAPRTGVFACVWMVFSTKDRCVCLCVDGVQHQGQVCLPVCGWCSAPRTGVFACVWMVFSTKDRCVCLCVGGVQHQGQACLFEDYAETAELAESVEDSNGVYFVPAFNGIQAPVNDPRACSLFLGLSSTTTKAHMLRALLESLVFRNKQLYETMLNETKIPITYIRADGGVSNNSFVMQLTADLLNRTITRPKHVDMSSLGAAFLAGLAVGIWKDKEELKRIKGGSVNHVKEGMWKSKEELKGLQTSERVFQPRPVSEGVWEKYRHIVEQWERAVKRSLYWYPAKNE
ncbi:putative glycerol kinase 5 [Branchiostoma belcheri]|nr:putative glycerol kinase 5 [Branchiostoma belcheri]